VFKEKKKKLTTGYKCHERKARPVPAAVRQREEANEKRHYPKISKNDVKRPIVEIIAAERYGEHCEDLQDCRRDRQHIGVKGREANAL
jgi:hypothetical protein